MHFGPAEMVHSGLEAKPTVSGTGHLLVYVPAEAQRVRFQQQEIAEWFSVARIHAWVPAARLWAGADFAAQI